MRSAVGQFFHYIVDFSIDVSSQAIYIMYGSVGAAVDGFRLSGDQQFAAVRRKAVAVERLERTFAGCGRIKQYFHLFSCLERIFDDLSAFRIHLRIVFSVSGDGNHPVDVSARNFPDTMSFKSSACLPCAKLVNAQRQMRIAILSCFIILIDFFEWQR